MHSEGRGPGQTHNSQPLSQEHTPASGTSAFPVSTTASNPTVMLSAGQLTVPTGIFSSGLDGISPSQRFTTGFTPAQYQTLYGIPSQLTGHLPSFQPHSSFFPSFGGSGTSGHRFLQSTLLTGARSDQYPKVQSYSAMLATMGNQVQHLETQVLDRAPRISSAGVPVTEHSNPFLTTERVNLPSLLSSSQPLLSSSISSSPGPPAGTHNLIYSNMKQEAFSSRHSEQTGSFIGKSLHGETSRDLRTFGNSSSIHEDKPTFSPSTHSTSGHIPKVSFDSNVKEYGGNMDSPTGRGDIFTRASLSGKAGSRKHRILTRPSDSEIPDDTTEVHGSHSSHNEPLSKRSKLSSYSSTSAASNAQQSLTYSGDIQKPTNNQFSETPTSSYNILRDNNMNIKTVPSNHSLCKNIYENQLNQQLPFQHENEPENTSKQLQHRFSPSSSHPSTTPFPENHPPHLQYPSHFQKGSIIQLADGNLKRVEDLQTEDFLDSAEISSDLKVDTSRVVKIEENFDCGTAMLSFSVGQHRVHVTVEATLEHPFFVFGQGWSSCSVSRTLARYGLDCQKLNVGDVCVSLTHKDVTNKAADLSKHQQQIHKADSYSNLTRTSNTDPSDHNTPSTQNSKPLSASSSSGNQSTLIQRPSILLHSTQDNSSDSSSLLPSPVKLEQPDNPILPSSSSSPGSVYKRRLSQTELPPPTSTIVLVKKENNNTSYKKTDLRRADDKTKEDPFKDHNLHAAS